MKNLIALLLFTGIIISSCRDQCKQNDCSFHGYCADGSCICDEGYLGESCHISLQPQSVELNEISILSFPLTNNGESWDPIGMEGKPDVYFKLYQGSEQIYISGKVNKDLDIEKDNCTEMVALTLTDFESEYVLKIYDKDEGEIVDEYMCALSFSLADLIQGKQPELTLENNHTEISLKMSFVY